jgi:hypothetical protein
MEIWYVRNEVIWVTYYGGKKGCNGYTCDINNAHNLLKKEKYL